MNEYTYRQQDFLATLVSILETYNYKIESTSRLKRLFSIMSKVAEHGQRVFFSLIRRDDPFRCFALLHGKF